MPEEGEGAYRPAESAVGRWIERAARALALLGGVLLAGLALMQVVSITLRAVIGKPIPGDFELIQVGSAVVVFCFLPMAHLHRHNFAVTLFTDRLGPRARALMELIGSLAMLVIAGLLLWRMAVGAESMHALREHTMVLNFQLWWAFVPILAALAVLVASAALVLARDLRRGLG
jgi:TRAP-type C4-dicarboxylate transport system permease small subunit